MKISVVTAVYNMQSTIEDCVRSVQAQRYLEMEHIVIDGCSSDGTLEKVRKLKHKNMKIVSEPDGGIYYAMNKGWKLASGEIVAFLNADDLYASDTVLHRVGALFTNKDIDACFADLCYVRQNDTSDIVRNWKSRPFRTGDFARGWCPAHPTFFVRRSILQKIDGFNIAYRIAADVELMMRLLEIKSIRAVYVPELWVRMRVGGVTNRSVSNIFRQNREIINALKDHDLYSGIVRFLGGKILSRSKQYFTRKQTFK